MESKEIIYSILSKQTLSLNGLMECPEIMIKKKAVIINLNKLREEKKIVKMVGKNFSMKNPLYKVIK